ncbi:MAG: type II toxin-antitoxin system VapC family toxin [bacterium]|nr:type II toxin-antitoxin system VapC family toxin [bacterium]
MPVYLLDSSALGKYYHQEVGTIDVIRLVQEPTARHIVSRLTITESYAVFARKMRTGAIDEDEFERLWQQFGVDVAQGLFEIVRIVESHHGEAERLIRKYARRSLRTSDALQLAVALDVNRRTILDQFVCADIRLCEIATEEQLSVFNPAQP